MKGAMISIPMISKLFEKNNMLQFYTKIKWIYTIIIHFDQTHHMKRTIGLIFDTLGACGVVFSLLFFCNVVYPCANVNDAFSCLYICAVCVQRLYVISNMN